MPLTVNVGYSEKLGQPDFGSIGASCHIECELDGHLAFDDPETFQSKVHDLYAACVRAVQDQLARRNGGHAETSNPPRNGAHKPSNGAKTTSSETPSTTSNGSTKHRASKRQLDYLEQLARQVPGLGVRRL